MSAPRRHGSWRARARTALVLLPVTFGTALAYAGDACASATTVRSSSVPPSTSVDSTGMGLTTALVGVLIVMLLGVGLLVYKAGDRGERNH